MWIAGIFLLLAWSFVLGVLVGRGSIPEKLKHLTDLKKKLATLEQQYDTGAQKSSKSRAREEAPEGEEFDFFQKLAEKKEEKIVLSQQSKPNAAPKPTNRVSVSPSTGSSGVHYTIQLASFDSREKAAKLVQVLGKKGISAYYVMADTKRGRYYRVRYGDFESREAALSELGVVSVKTGLRGFVCKR